MACSVAGTLGLVLNVGLFTLLLATESTRTTLTEREQHWREQVVTFFGCVLNLLLVGAGTGLAIALGIRTVDPKSLIATAGLGIYAGLTMGPCSSVALTTAVIDGVKNYREGKHLLN